MTDDRFDEFLRRAGQRYNEPPATPREAMWQHIQAARRDASVPLASSVVRRSWIKVATAVAALLVIGIGIGRWTTSVPFTEPSSTPVAETDGRVFRAAAFDHLGQLDTFISLFRADVAIGQSDPETGRWVRELLATTRLMLDSPAGADTELRQLLEDLELVLVQIAEYVGRQNRTELELIEEDLEETDLLLRLQAELAVRNGALPVQGDI